MFVKLLTSDTELCPERMSVHPASQGSEQKPRDVTLKWMGRLLWKEPNLAGVEVRSIALDSQNNNNIVIQDGVAEAEQT